jgi:putative salt-induced outer membrane protein
MRLALTLALLAALPFTARADEADRDDLEERAESRGWSGEAEFGLAIASGNADSETVNGKFAFLREEERWFYGLNAAALRAKSDDELSANRYQLGAKLGYDFSEDFYGFGTLRYERDDFASYEYQGVASAGVGYRFIDTRRTLLLGEFGPGLRRSQPIDELVGTPPVLTSFDAETDAIARGSLDFKHELTANTTLTNLLLAESGDGSTFLQNDLGIAVQMSERFALKAGYQVRHTTEVPEGIEKTDTLFTTNLVVGF